VDDEFDDLQGSSHNVIKVLAWHLPGGSDKKQEDTVRIANIETDIRIRLSTTLVPHKQSALV
jgi:hypothetical protein